MGIPHKTISTMRSLAADMNKKRTSERRNVHQTLLLRAVMLLKNHLPETEKFYSPMLQTMMQYTARPDKKGDYENGMGRHYYCHSTISGTGAKNVNGYFRNGVKMLSPSARTMFEEDYTMALTMYQDFQRKRAAEFLGRAIHMLADICCLPHCTGMTYYSAGSSFHKAYEELAEAMYPEFVSEQISGELPAIFEDCDGFGTVMNFLSGETASALKSVCESPESGVTSQLLRTEKLIAALLLRFYNDISRTPQEARYIANNMHIRFLHDNPPLSIKLTDHGIILHGVNPFPQAAINVTRTTFYAAHRHDGLFTLSPAKDHKHRVLQVSGGKIKLARFSPIHAEQLFRL